MTKIKILLGFSICSALMNLFHLAMQVILFDFWKNFNNKRSEDFFFGKSSWLIQNVLSFILLLGTIYICIALFRILKNGYFNMRTSNSFKVGGRFLCLVAILSMILVALDATITNHFGNLTTAITTNMLLFLMGFGILTISQIIKNGLLLKQENDLTI